MNTIITTLPTNLPNNITIINDDSEEEYGCSIKKGKKTIKTIKNKLNIYLIYNGIEIRSK